MTPGLAGRKGSGVWRLASGGRFRAFGRGVEKMAAGQLAIARVIELRRNAAAVVPHVIAAVGEAAADEFPGEPGHAAADDVERRAALAGRGQRVEQLPR